MPPPKTPEKPPTPTRSSNKGTGAAAPRTSTRGAQAAAPRPPPPPVPDRTEEFESFEPPDRPTAPVDISGFIEEAKKGPPPPPAAAVAPARRVSKPEMPAVAPRKSTKGELAAVPAAAPKSSGNTPVPPRKPTRGDAPASGPSAAAPLSPASPKASGNTPIPPRKPTKQEAPAAPATPSKPARPAAPNPPDGADEVTEAAGNKDKLITTNPQMKTMEAKSRRLTLAVIGACALVIGGVVVGAYFVLANDRPEDNDLRLVYPYGFQGKRGAKGEVAPGANEVQFKLVGEVPACGANHTKCLRYQYTGEGGFNGSMLVGKTRDKQWERIGEEGMPFQPAADD